MSEQKPVKHKSLRSEDVRDSPDSPEDTAVNASQKKKKRKNRRKKNSRRRARARRKDERQKASPDVATRQEEAGSDQSPGQGTSGFHPQVVMLCFNVVL